MGAQCLLHDQFMYFVVRSDNMKCVSFSVYLLLYIMTWLGRRDTPVRPVRRPGWVRRLELIVHGLVGRDHLFSFTVHHSSVC